MIALVTGGGGFLGNAVVHKLIARGSNVRSFSRNKYLNLKRIGVEQFRGDITNRDLLFKAAEGCDIIFHVAAKPGIWGTYSEYYRVNVEGTQNVIDACYKHKIQKLVFTSTPSVVFAGKDQESVNELEPYPNKYLAHYPKTKAIAEKKVLKANGKGISTVSLRPHLIWGPGDNHLIPRLILKAKSRTLRKIGKESKLVDSVYIDNAADAHILAADRLAPKSKLAGKAYFISQGEPVPMCELIDKILKAANLDPVNKTISPLLAYAIGGTFEIIYKIFRLKDEPPMTRFLASQLSTSHWFDISAAKKDFGYNPSVSMEEGLARLTNWFQQKGTE